MFWLLPGATPAPGDEIDPDIVTPGVMGFVMTFAVIVAVVILVVDMVRRMRRIRYRAEIAERLDAEESDEGLERPASPTP